MNTKIGVLLSAAVMLFLSGVATAAEVVNLNKADAAAMQQNLIGIGPIKAEAIVAFRKKNGKYSSVNDLEGVKGIGPALIKKNKKYLSMSKGVVKGDAAAYATAKKAAGKKASTKKTSTKKKSTTKAAKTTAKPSKATKTSKTSKTSKTAKTAKTAKTSKAAKTSKTAKKSSTKSTSKKSTTKKKKKKATKKKVAPAS